jgi:putative spermidine/putrescine transport system permease protein
VVQALINDPGGALLRLFCALVFAFLLAPIVIIVLTSFTATTTVTFPPTEFSLQWYGRFFEHLVDAPGVKPELFRSLLMSIQIGLIVALLATVAGVLAAYAFRKYNFFGRAAFRQLLLMPLMFPQIVTGIALLVWFSSFRFVGPIERLVIGHVILTLPYVIVTVGASLELHEESLEEAAIGLGASHLQSFWRITLPLVRPGIVAGAIFAFIISFNAFTVTFFLYSGDARPLPMWIYEYLNYFLDPTLAVISTFLIALTLLAVVTLERLIGIRRLASR